MSGQLAGSTAFDAVGGNRRFESIIGTNAATREFTHRELLTRPKAIFCEHYLFEHNRSYPSGS